MVIAMRVVQLKDRTRSKDLMFILGFIETMDQLAMAYSVHWYRHVLRRALYFEVKGQRKKWKKQVEEESVKVGLRREDTL